MLAPKLRAIRYDYFQASITGGTACNDILLRAGLPEMQTIIGATNRVLLVWGLVAWKVPIPESVRLTSTVVVEAATTSSPCHPPYYRILLWVAAAAGHIGGATVRGSRLLSRVA